jgi:vacuolar-type H+-ATPase subunit E/Vma4
MALDELLAVLQREAETEAEAIVAAGRAEAAAIQEQSAAELAQRRGRITRELESRGRSELERALAGFRRAARGEELRARERLMQRILAEARSRLPGSTRRPAFQGQLPDLTRQALEALGSRPATLRCSPELQETLGHLVRDRSGLRVIPDEGIGTGFRLISDDGSLVIDATLEDRLLALDRRVRQLILARLEHGP